MASSQFLSSRLYDQHRGAPQDVGLISPIKPPGRHGPQKVEETLILSMNFKIGFMKYFITIILFFIDLSIGLKSLILQYPFNRGHCFSSDLKANSLSNQDFVIKTYQQYGIVGISSLFCDQRSFIYRKELLSLFEREKEVTQKNLSSFILDKLFSYYRKNRLNSNDYMLVTAFIPIAYGRSTFLNGVLLNQKLQVQMVVKVKLIKDENRFKKEWTNREVFLHIITHTSTLLLENFRSLMGTKTMDCS